MALDLKKLRAVPNRVVSIEESYDAVKVSQPVFSIAGRVRVSGEAGQREQKITLALRIEATAVQPCSRCLTDVSARVILDEHLEFIPEGAAESPWSSEAHTYSVGEATLDLQPYVVGLIANALAVKPLCRPDCQGLCPTCGVPLNEGPCGCPRESQGDPRLKALKELLD